MRGLLYIVEQARWEGRGGIFQRERCVTYIQQYLGLANRWFATNVIAHRNVDHVPDNGWMKTVFFFQGRTTIVPCERPVSEH